jgi:hypothetical protein
MDNNQKIAAVLSVFLATIMLCGGAGFVGYIYGSQTEYQAIYNQGYAQGKDAGYDDGYKSGYEASLKPSPEQQTSVSDILQNPTYQEMKLFLAQDTTNSNNYEEDMYVCTDFAVAVNNNAESQGIRCAIVDMFYPDGYGHTIVAFETTDRGLIFIEPQFDREVEMVIGESYSKSNKFTAAPRDDTINRYLIAW